MSRYKELSDKLQANHAVCKSIQAELDTLQPPEMWVVFYKKEHDAKPTAHPTEAEAKDAWTSLQEKVVRYVLPTDLTPEPKAE